MSWYNTGQENIEMTFKVIYGDAIGEDLTEDYKGADKCGGYRFGKSAIYFPRFPFGAEYIPLSVLEGAWVRKSTMSIKGCCAGQIPIYVLHVCAGAEFFQNLKFDRKQDAERALSLLKQYRPGLSDAPEKRNE